MADDLTPDPRGTFVPGGVLVRSAPTPVSRTVAGVTVSSAATGLMAPVSAPLAAPVSGLMGPMGPMGPIGPRGLQGEAGPAGGIILPAYTVSNVTTDRVLDADSTSIDEVVDVLGTLIADIQSGVGTGGGAGDLDVFTATVDGLVPASGGGTANYLRADGTWTAPAGTGGGGGGSIPAYALTNVTTDRIMDADLVTIDEMADVLGTLITDIAAGGVGGGGSGGSTQALAETRAAAISSTIDVAVKSLHTAGYSQVGDGGHGLYKRVNAAPTHAAQFRSMDRFLANGTTNATTGGYWELVPEGGEVRIEQFGGKGNTPYGAAITVAPTYGTDNYAPFIDALAFVNRTYDGSPDVPHSYAIRFGVGRYYFSQSIDVYSVVHISGHSGYIDNIGVGPNTTWIFPAGSNGITFHATNSSSGGGAIPTGASNSSVFEGIALDFPGSTKNLTKVAVEVRTQMLLQRIGVYRAPGEGFYIHAYAGSGGVHEGNANNWVVNNCSVYSCFSHALHIYGNDANGGQCSGFTTGPGEVGGCGVLEASFLGGTTFTGLQITGYGQHGVHRAGKHYRFISWDPAKGTVTPGTDDTVWMFVGNGAADAGFWQEWVSSSTNYIAQLPILAPGGYGGDGGLASQRSVFVGPYVEGPVGVLVGRPNIAIGGQCAYYRGDIASASFITDPILQGLASADGYSLYKEWTTDSTSYTYCGATLKINYGTVSAADPSQGRVIWGHERAIDANGPFEYRYLGNDLRYSVPGQRTIYEITSSTTTDTMGRSAAQPYYFLVRDFALGDPNNSNNTRVIGFRDAAPTTGAHARGEFFFNVAPTAGGTFGWSCITSGTPGTWKAIPVPA